MLFICPLLCVSLVPVPHVYISHMGALCLAVRCMPVVGLAEGIKQFDMQGTTMGQEVTGRQMLSFSLFSARACLEPSVFVGMCMRGGSL